MLLSEVGAAVSVLLGFAPPATLSAAGSSKASVITSVINTTSVIPLPHSDPFALSKFLMSLLQLNEILMPNPFNRPRAVFLLDVRGAEGS